MLADGDLLGIFPEGGITNDGTLKPFKGGVMRILEKRPGAGHPARAAEPVGLVLLARRWRGHDQPFRRGLFSRVGLVAGDPMPASAVTPAGLRERVGRLLEPSAAVAAAR